MWIPYAILSAVFAASAQPADVKVKPPRGHELIGEVLKYDAKVNKILHGISVAELTMSVAAQALKLPPDIAETR